MRRIVLCFITCLAFSTTAKAGEVVTIAADVWCPYNCAPGSERPGFMIEIAQRAFARHGISVHYVNLPWSRAIEETRQHKYTAIVGASQKDAPDFVFPAVPQGWMQNSFYVKKGNSWRYAGEASLVKIALGAVADYAYGEPVDAHIQKHKSNLSVVQLVSGDNAQAVNLKKLLAGRIHALIEDEHVMDYHLAQMSGASAVEKAGQLPPSEQNKLYVAFSPQEAAAKHYAEILAQETKALRTSGELAAILAKYGVTDWQR